MATLWRWVKFFLITETTPIKTKVYFQQILWFRRDIEASRREQDWRRLLQYRFMFVLMGLFAVYCIYMYRTELNEFDSYILLDLHSWFRSGKLMYLAFLVIQLMAMYAFYLLYFTSNVGYFVDWLKKIVLETSSIQYHWPYHYKLKDCSRLIRETFVRIFQSLQLLIIITCKYAHMLSSILIIFV